MKKFLTLLLFVTLFVSCSSDDNNDNNGPETPKTESLKGQSFYSFLRIENDLAEGTTYDVYRVFTFTSDKEVTEHTAKGSADGDTLFIHKGTYTYTHPDLKIKIDEDGFFMDATVKINDAKNEFSYKSAPNSETLIFKKR